LPLSPVQQLSLSLLVVVVVVVLLAKWCWAPHLLHT
jgi:hypothetical protein